MLNIPFLRTDNPNINAAYRLAVSTVVNNIQPYKAGLLSEEVPAIMAGLGYNTPWTRDTAINVWNGVGLLFPDVAENTLKSVMGRDENGCFIDGQYWDKIIWVIGAWWQYLYNGDKKFLSVAYEATVNTLEAMEKDEFDKEKNLFRGPACYGDGVSAYGDIYANHGTDFILDFARFKKELCADKGFGMPMMVLSTNCLYYYAYVLADRMAGVLGFERKYTEKAEKMHSAINKNFWNEEKGNYDYYIDNFGGCDYQEGIGISFAVLFGVADDEKIKKILSDYHTAPCGMPCVYPTFKRYETEDKMGFGRHSGTVWPHIQGFWADAVSILGEKEIFEREFVCQTENALSSVQFAEIYHPVTGAVYGGRQERFNVIQEYKSEVCQTWSATAYLRNVLMDLLGLKFKEDGIYLSPMLISGVKYLKLTNLHYRNAELNIEISGNGTKIQSVKINGKESNPFISAELSGKTDVKILLG